jgi:DNA invertase Pin-like site-specific DNA recombinase
MRVAAYVREVADSSVFAQSEQVRRWAPQEGHHLLATFQDVRTPTGESTNGGLKALLGLVDNQDVDAVLVASLDVLSPDLIVQEVIMADLRRRGVQVVSTDASEVGALGDPPRDTARLFIRDVLARHQEHQQLEASAPETPSDDVLIELIKTA